jgi:hypothetical protein
MEGSQGQDAEWVQKLIRDFQDKLTCGLYETIYDLGAPTRDTLMEGQARACVSAFLEMADMPAGMEMDSFLSV